MPAQGANPQSEGSPGMAGDAPETGPLDAPSGPGDEGDVHEEVDPEDLEAFLEELKEFFRERNMELRVPRFYGCSVNLLKLWRAVCSYGGYDKVTAGKLWRAVGNYFNPPKSCTTLSWSFRGFYERSLLDYERVHGIPTRYSQGASHQTLKDKLEGGRNNDSQDAADLSGLPPTGAPNEAGKAGAGTTEAGTQRVDRGQEKVAGKEKDSPGTTGQKAAHGGVEERSPGEQGAGDAGRTPDGAAKRLKRSPLEGQFRSGAPQDARAASQKPQGTAGQGRAPGAPPSGSGDGAGAGPRMGKRKGSRDPGRVGEGGGERERERERGGEKEGEAAVVWDVGEECPWVRVSVRRSPDCFEVFALVPGLLREEIKVQLEGPGRLVIAGAPGSEDNPWGVRRFKKIVILPGSVVASETSAIVSLHGQLYVHLPLAPPHDHKDKAVAVGADKSSSGGRSG